MLRDYPLNCICGNKPTLTTKPMCGKGSVEYYAYSCDGCDISTFFTRTEECCRELWNAAIDRKLKK